MQFPVPQFTDVEDRLIANLTLRQFGILFGTGVIIFMVFSATKNVLLTSVVFLFVGVPGLVIAFLKVNGRPLYRTFSHLVKFFIQPRQMLFHKQGLDSFELRTFKSTQPIIEQPSAPQQHKSIEEVSSLLQKQRLQEQELINSTLGQQVKKQ